MSRPDATAGAQIDQPVVKPVWLVFLDFVGDPVRANTSGREVTIAASGQPDLDGTYDGITPDFASITEVKAAIGGSGTVTARLSGIRGLDDDTRTLLADPANWQGRVARLWRMIRNQADVQQGAIQHYYTGYMVGLTHVGSARQLMIEVAIESYLAAFSQASNRTYLSQEDFDELDLSASAALAIVNGNDAVPGVSVPAGPSVRDSDPLGKRWSPY